MVNVPEMPMVPEHPSPVLGPPQRSESGLEWWVLKQGDGAKPLRGRQVEIDYVGWRADGHRFDRGRGFRFLLGYGQVLRAWDEAVADMKPGEHRQLRVPPRLGFGARAGFSGDEVLTYEIALVQVR